MIKLLNQILEYYINSNINRRIYKIEFEYGRIPPIIITIEIEDKDISDFIIPLKRLLDNYTTKNTLIYYDIQIKRRTKEVYDSELKVLVEAPSGYSLIQISIGEY